MPGPSAEEVPRTRGWGEGEPQAARRARVLAPPGLSASGPGVHLL